MSYVVLARKWRPMSFRDLVGQDHVAQTLANAIATDRVAHAFLFTGVRGVGKTTSARILAKALNCLGPPGSPQNGPTADPCLVCPACLEIAKGTDLDVQEIDGASYNGVDEVRRLQDSLPYRPTRDRYKIVIVDEVHMLSQAAWNAFLKTLEEPPPHVKFIFATTEVHKVPVTILSRVQRFDFKMISARAIAERLRFVLAEEKILADDAAVSIVARTAQGSMRDAMSLLDQVISFAGGELRGAEVARVLGVVGTRVLSELALATVLHKPAEALKLVDQLAEEGFDIVHLARDLLGLFRDLVVAKVAPADAGLIDRTAEEQEEIRALVGQVSEQDLIRLHQTFSKSFDEVARSVDPRAGLEMLLVKLALRPELLSVDELLHRLAHLERRLAADPGARRHGGGDLERRPPPPRAEASPPEAASKPRPRDSRPSAERAGRADASAADDPDPSPVLPVANERLEPPPRTSQERPTPDAPAESAQPLVSAIPDPPMAAESRPTVPSAAPQAGDSEEVAELSERVRGRDPRAGALLDQLYPPLTLGRELSFAYDAGFIFEREVEDVRFRELIVQEASALLGQAVTLSLHKGPTAAHGRVTLAEERERKRREKMDAALRRAQAHPLVQAAKSILNAEVTSVRLTEEP